MSRETVKEKAGRYLLDGRLEIELVSQGRVAARCRSDSGDSYTLAYDPRHRKWDCSCPSRQRCCHVVAAQLVTERPA